jgi:hypothetical protein
VALLKAWVRPVGLAVRVIFEDVLVADGETVSQVAVLLAWKDTAPIAGDVVNVICCVAGVVEPTTAEGTVQLVMLGMTVGGGVPVATSVASERLKLPGVLLPVKRKLIVPELSGVVGMEAGTAVIMFPSGMVALAVTTASPARLQLLMPSVSDEPTLSVSVTETGGVDEEEQLNPANDTVTLL